MEAEEPPQPRRGGARRVTLSEGQRFCVTALSLADADAARAQPLVTVWAEVGHEERAVGMVWSEQPAAPVPPLELDDGEFVLRHDSAWSSVRLYGYYLDPPDPDGEGAATRRQFLVDIDAEELLDEEEEEEEEVGQEYEPLTEEDLAERYDSDNGEDDEGEEEEDEDQPLPGKASDAEAAAGESSKIRWNSIALVAAPSGGRQPKN